MHTPTQIAAGVVQAPELFVVRKTELLSVLEELTTSLADAIDAERWRVDESRQYAKTIIKKCARFLEKVTETIQLTMAKELNSLKKIVGELLSQVDRPIFRNTMSCSYYEIEYWVRQTNQKAELLA